jgi:hypothetical protein
MVNSIGFGSPYVAEQSFRLLQNDYSFRMMLTVRHSPLGALVRFVPTKSNRNHWF